jgi:hypothetical protein
MKPRALGCAYFFAKSARFARQHGKLGRSNPGVTAFSEKCLDLLPAPVPKRTLYRPRRELQRERRTLKREMRLFATSIWKLITAVIALTCTAAVAEATEKYWIAHEAQLIVVGTLHPGRGFWWTDGWHETGTITVNEVLHGQAPSNQIDFRLTIRCYSPWWNRWRPTHFLDQFSDRSLWLLRTLDDRTWEPANGCDSGCRSLSQRADFERYIRLEKH